MPWLTGWAHRKEIRYGTVFPGSNLTDFPVLLKVTTDSDIAAELSDGNGITVTAADGDTEIPFGLYPGADLSAGTFILRFLASPLTGASTGDVMAYIYYDDAETTVEDKAGVVSNDYLIFMPLEEDPSGSAPQMYDWVSETNIGTSNGSMTGGDLVAAEVGKGLDLDGSNDYIGMSYSNPAGDFTIEIAAYARSIGSDHDSDNIFSSNGSGAYGVYLSLGGGHANMYDSASNNWLDGSAAVSGSTWYSFAFVRDGTTKRIYNNGAADGTATMSGAFAAGSAARIGSRLDELGGDAFFDGIIDEFRTSSVARSADWLEYAYENDNNNADTVTLGAEEDEGGGGGPVTTGNMLLCF